MRSIFQKAFELIISLEEYTRFYMRKGMCYSYHHTQWLEFPVLMVTILDMLICLYLALYLQSTTAYVLANILFHLLSIPMFVSVIFFLDDNYYNPDPKQSIKKIDIPFFIMNTVLLVPFLVIKILLLSFYIEDISQSATFIDPFVLQIIWIIISLPVFVRYGTIFITLYCGIFLFVAIVFCFIFPVYISGRPVLTYYYITNEDLDRMYKEIDPKRKEYEEIDAYNFDSFITSKESTEKSPLLEDYCRICSSILEEEKMRTVKLDCSHVFHSLCLEQWIFRSNNSCPSCSKHIIYHNTKYKPPKPHFQKGSKSWITSLHYYPIIISIKVFQFCGFTVINSCSNSIKRLLRYIYFIPDIIICICLPCISVLTQNRFICVLSNLLIVVVLFHTLMQYFAIFVDDLLEKYVVKFTGFWKDDNLCKRSTNDIIGIITIFQILFLFIFGIIGLSLYFIIPSDFDKFALVDNIFLGIISYKLFMDTLLHFAVLHILCLVFTMMYDVLIVFPVTLVYMAIECKGISEIWLRI